MLLVLALVVVLGLGGFAAYRFRAEVSRVFQGGDAPAIDADTVAGAQNDPGLSAQPMQPAVDAQASLADANAARADANAAQAAQAAADAAAALASQAAGAAPANGPLEQDPLSDGQQTADDTQASGQSADEAADAAEQAADAADAAGQAADATDTAPAHDDR